MEKAASAVASRELSTSETTAMTPMMNASISAFTSSAWTCFIVRAAAGD